MKKPGTDPVSEQKKAKCAEQSENHAKFHGPADCFVQERWIAGKTCPGYRRNQHDRKRIADDGWEHDGRKDHAGENPVNAQRVSIGVTESAQKERDEDRLRAGKNTRQKTV